MGAMERITTLRLKREIATYLQPPAPAPAPAHRARCVGITGATRCGKSWIASRLRERSVGTDCLVIAQTSYWRCVVDVELSDGRTVASADEPACTDHASFARAIDTAVASGASLVVVEGSSMLHDPRIVALLEGSPIVLVHVARAECVRRCSAAAGARNPNSQSAEECDAVTWPAHERYLARSVVPLGNRIEHVDAPRSVADVDAIVDSVLRRLEGAPAAAARAVAPEGAAAPAAASEAATAAASSEEAAADPLAALTTAKAMRDAGLITEVEFEATKCDILRSLASLRSSAPRLYSDRTV